MIRTQCGINLIELMIVVAIVAILAMVAAPSFTEFLAATRLSSTSAQIVSDLNQARSEAVKRNNRVLICVRNGAGTACGSGTDWGAGWVVCIDSDNDNDCDASTTADPNPMVVRGALAPGLALTGTAAVVRFNPNGSQGTGGAATLTLAGASSRVVTIAATGNISSY